MKQLHVLVAIVFAVVGVAIYASSDGEKRTPALLALLISNVSLAALSIETALERLGHGAAGGIGLRHGTE